MVTQPSASHHLLCVRCGSVCVRALLCLVFITAVHLGNKVIFYPLSPLTLQVTVNSYNATRTILNLSVPEIRNFSDSSHSLFVIVAIHLPTSKGWKLEFGCLFRELNLGSPARPCTNEHVRTLRECWRLYRSLFTAFSNLLPINSSHLGFTICSDVAQYSH